VLLPIFSKGTAADELVAVFLAELPNELCSRSRRSLLIVHGKPKSDWQPGATGRTTASSSPTSIRTPIAPRNLTRSLKALLKKAGLPTRTRFHDLRHSCGTLLHSQGVPARAIAEVLGHTQLRTTERYTHATRAAVKMLASAVRFRLSLREPSQNQEVAAVRLSPMAWRSTGGQTVDAERVVGEWAEDHAAMFGFVHE